jgi:hypothetical protein
MKEYTFLVNRFTERYKKGVSEGEIERGTNFDDRGLCVKRRIENMRERKKDAREQDTITK